MKDAAVNRRAFLAGTAAALLAAGPAAVARPTAAARIGVTTVSLRDLIPFRLPGAPPPPKGRLDLVGAPHFVADTLGLRKLELWNLQFEETTEAYCRSVAAAASQSGVEIINVQVDSRLDLGAAADSDREAALAEARAWIDRAALLGAPSLRVNMSSLNPKSPFDVTRTASAFSELARHAAPKNIMLLTENHFGHSVKIENVVALLEAIDLPNVRTIFDWGNVPGATTESVIAAAERLAPWLHLVSAKGSEFDADYRAVNYDVAAIVRATERLGFRGDYSIELFGPTPTGFDPVKAITAMRLAIEAGLG